MGTAKILVTGATGVTGGTAMNTLLELKVCSDGDRSVRCALERHGI